MQVVNLTRLRVPKNLGDLDIDEMRSGERIARIEEPRRDGVGGSRGQKHLDEGGGVDDGDLRSRQTASAGGTEGATAPRRAMRWRNSSTVGRAATSRISASRKSDSDMPARAARAFSLRCSASGTFRI